MEEINLDFLEYTPIQNQHIEWAKNEFNFELKRSEKKCESKSMFEMAQKIANVDELLEEIDKLKSKNTELQQQLKGFQRTAQQVHELYIKEKNELCTVKQNFEKLQTRYQKMDTDLTSISLMNDQLKARLAQYDGRPVSFDNLVGKYIRIMHKLQGHDILRYYPDKDLVERLREYCVTMKIKIPSVNSAKKSKSKGNTVKTEEIGVQCDLLASNSLKKDICQIVETKPKLKDQNIQCSTIKHDRACQYINTMITRQTNTEKVIQKHVKTMFPESPPIADILKVYTKWADIRAVSPLLKSPHSIKSMQKLCTIGTCTMLCNIRRKIDYLSLNNSNIKQEVFTPSVSPTPNSYPTATNRSRMDSLLNSLPPNINSNSLLNSFNSTTHSSLSQLSSSAFNELWQIFGKMLLSLLQTSNTGNSNTIQNAPLNQQQFLNWLLDLYMNTQPQNATAAETHDLNMSASPILFNNAPVLSTNIIRPQPAKTLQDENVVRRQEPEANIAISSNRIDNSKNQISISEFSKNILHCRSVVSNEGSQTQITSNTKELHTTNICESEMVTLQETTVPENFTQNRKKTRLKDKMMHRIPELLPKDKLYKKKRKALNRLLRSKKQRKKSIKCKKFNKQSLVVIADEMNNDSSIETAVDFLQNFAVTQSTNFSETEKNFLNQISNENVIDKALTTVSSDQLELINPSTSLTHALLTLNTDEAVLELEKSEYPKQMAQKYEELFGDSDSEFEDEEIQIEKVNIKSVIKSTGNIGSGHIENATSTDNKVWNLNCSQDSASPASKRSIDCNQRQTIRPKSTNLSVGNNFGQTPTNTENFIFDKYCNPNINQETLLPTATLEDVEFTHLPEVLSRNNIDNSECMHLDANNQIIDTSSTSKSNSFAIIGKSLENDLELSSEGEDEYVAVINESKAKFSNENVANKEIKDINNINNSEENERKNGIPTLENSLSGMSKSVFEILKSTSNSNKNDSDQSIDSHRRVITLSPLNEMKKTMDEGRMKTQRKINDGINSHENIIDTESLVQTDKYTSGISTEFLIPNSKETVSFNNVKDSDQVKILPPLIEWKNCTLEKTIKVQSNLNEDDSFTDLITSTPMHTSDLEKDLEISSEDEYLINEYLNNTHKFPISTTEVSKVNFSEYSSNVNYNSQKFKNGVKFTEEEYLTPSRSEDMIIQCSTLQKESVTSNANFTNKSALVCEHVLSRPTMLINSTDKHITPMTKNEEEKVSKSSSKEIVQTLCPENTSLNQSKSNENSQDSSDITLSNSILNEETVNINKIPHTDNTRTVNEDVSLKLLGLTKIPNYEQIHFNESNEILKLENNKHFKAQKDIKSKVKILSCSTIKSIPNINNRGSDIKDMASQQYLNIANKNDSHMQIFQKPEAVVTCCVSVKETNNVLKVPNGFSMIHQDHSHNQYNNTTQTIKSAFESLPSNAMESYKSMDIADENNLNDTLSAENELIIDEEQNNNTDYSSNSISTDSEENCRNTINSTNLFSLLHTGPHVGAIAESIEPICDDLLNEVHVTSYKELAADSIKPIGYDLLNIGMEKIALTEQIITKRGHKHKSACLPEAQACKRPQRLIAKPLIIEESQNLSRPPIELGKYTKYHENTINHTQLISPIKKDLNTLYVQPKYEIIQNLLDKENPLELGFFKEREIEKDITTKDIEILEVRKIQEPYKSDSKVIISNDSKKEYKQEQHNQLSLQKLQERENFNDQMDDHIIEPSDNFISYDSPQSPIPTQTHNEGISETFDIIPLERPPHFMPQNNHTLFDILIKSYKNVNQKQYLESINAKKFRRKDNILKQFVEEIKSYCYSEMELDLNCTSTTTINKLLSLMPDYELIQEAVINVAETAQGTNTFENDLPSIIQEMPPRHLSKCLQRLFFFLKNIVTRNSNFCKELINKIESVLFNDSQTQNLSLESSLNLTQLFLMASKIQEYMQIPKHPARLFLVKCIYFYLQTFVLLIHEVLMWYPTVLPYREDKTYDRSDALISVIQQVLMSNKYDMNKSDMRHKLLLSKLRFEYHFEPYKPSMEEVIDVLMEKLKNSKFYNIFPAFALLCKRLGVLKTEEIVFKQHLLPLANEYYNLALKTTEYDKRIAVLLEIISILLKPLPIRNIEIYFNEFSRFLNGFERQVIQEAALCCLLRLQHFNVEYCYNSMNNFQPTYNLSAHTQAMLKTFMHRRSLTFWNNLRSQHPRNLY